MMKTIMVVSQVSFQLGQVTFSASRRTSWKNCSGDDAAARRRRFRVRLVIRLFRHVSHLTLQLFKLGRSGGTRTHGPRFWRPMLYQLSYTPRNTSWPGAGARRPSFTYLMIFATTPAPTVRPPSRMAKRSFSSIAIGTISSTSTEILSPGITISVPSGSFTMPVTSVVRK